MPSRFSRTTARLAAAALLGFVALIYAQDAVDPLDGVENAGRMAAAADHSERLLAATVLLFLSSAAMLPAIAAVAALVRGRGRWLARVGAALAALGALGHVGVAGYYAAVAALPGGDAAEMTALLDRLDGTAAAAVLVVPAIACFALGVFLLGFALARARVLPRWSAAVPALAVVLEAAHVQPWPQVDLAQAVALLPFAWLAFRLLETTGRDPGVAGAPAFEATR